MILPNTTFTKIWFNFSQIFKVMLKFKNLSKVATEDSHRTASFCYPLRIAAHVADALDPSPLSILPGLTGGQGGGCAQCPHGAGSPQLAARHKRRGHREVKHSGGKVCRETPQRRSHRHLHSASVHSVRGSAHRPSVCASSGRVEEDEDGRFKPVRCVAELLAFPLHFQSLSHS